MSFRNLAMMVALALCAAAIPAHAQTSCADMEALKNQKQDEATIQKLEFAWSTAYTQGDTDFEKCLLGSDFTEIKSTGTVGNLDDELAVAAKNKGKGMAPPDPNGPKGKVLMHGNVAVAYGTYEYKNKAGNTVTMSYADYYIWENGQWHVFFAQQTQAPS
jgi:hypothetical protein